MSYTQHLIHSSFSCSAQFIIGFVLQFMAYLVYLWKEMLSLELYKSKMVWVFT